MSELRRNGALLQFHNQTVELLGASLTLMKHPLEQSAPDV